MDRSWLQANPTEQKSSRLTEIIAGPKSSSQDYMQRASQTPFKATSLSSQNPPLQLTTTPTLRTLICKGNPTSQPPPPPPPHISSHRFIDNISTTNTTGLSVYTDPNPQAAPHVPLDLENLTNLPDTRHLTSQPTYTLKQINSSFPTSIRQPHLPQDLSSHTEPQPLKSLTLHPFPIADHNLSLF